MIVIVLIAIGIFIPLKMTGSATQSQYDDFAICLAESGAKMYGAYWCPHCNNQKETFKGSFKLFDSMGGYVECDSKGKNAQPEKCQEKEIKGYPTWIIDEKTYQGAQSLYRLSALSGCSLNEK